MPKTTFAVLLIAGLAVVGGAGVALWMQGAAPLELASGAMLSTPRKLSAFTLQDAAGGSFTQTDLLGHWSLVFAGYTHCPDVCPTTLATLAAAKKTMGFAGDRFSVLFVSVDPQRDTPDRLLAYVHYFNPDFVALTGSDAQLQALGQSLGFVYEKVPRGDGANPNAQNDYLMDHSAALMVVDPKGRLAGYLTPPFDVKKLAADLTRIADSKVTPSA